ncbi:MAG: 50S ribosomal protein L7/L12 [Candidatus Eiseniibacteriota bacterium]|jgi:large subunit ribosomal protein L7/L12
MSEATKVQEVFDLITSMTVLEVNDLKKKFEDELGITAAAPAMMMAGAMPGAAGGVAEAAEQTEFDVVLSSPGDKKIQVIKVVRAITGLGLKEAKALVDEAPKPVKEKISKEEADDIRAKIEEAGGIVEVK